MTTITITDPVLLKQLADAAGPIEFRDPQGNIVHQSDGPIWVPPEGVVPPITDAEWDRRSATAPGGISTSELLKKLRGEE